ncbi:hypothetical protein C3747_21g188c [Trypanosoma cruzi]|uniref:Uncharacterized protein n=2 Tax=Trypanosoma cruzi TaxID=5693 RepID=Q4DQY2_TRYCC|nr:hypothetical protein, conserved [Trypanosoma cruzi]EAN94937.1 hypothetical protein, conserved [Trypanosoma cruzi]PWV16786.1 hypothetical protein C3747_21g188c [Trypanosoma cruzi]|eukprot:XP_816788.1 hypothetical protein [Trypanosoma cruzi strain CL Brener]
MPMSQPRFTTNPERIARLEENYNAGVEREKIPVAEREKLDLECLNVSSAKLRFLYQNSMESYGPDVKNNKVKEYNLKHGSDLSRKWFGIF